MKKLLMTLLVLAMISSLSLAEGGLTSFKTYDINIQEGEDVDMKLVSQDIFKPYDLTIVKIWATWCGYCIDEMPHLSDLKDMLPENVNLITICHDAYSEPQLAYQILQLTGATNFPTLIATQEMYDQFLNQVYSFPATYFMDSSGMPVGQPIFGAPTLGDDVAETYLAITNEVLADME